MIDDMLNTFLDKYTVFFNSHRWLESFMYYFYITPFASVLFYLPICLAIFHIHKKLITAGFKYDWNVYKFRFHVVNTIVNGGLYALLILLAELSMRIAFPTTYSVAKAKVAGLILVIAIIYVAFLCTIVLWYRTGSGILLYVYVLLAIFTRFALSHYNWSIVAFLCIMIPLMKYLRGKYKQTENFKWFYLHLGSIILFIIGIILFALFEVAEFDMR